MNDKYYKKYLKYKIKYLNLMNKQFEGGFNADGLTEAQMEEAVTFCCETLQ